MAGERGFTFIEVIAAVAILVLVLMAFLPVFPQTLAWTKTAEAELTSGYLLSRVAHDVRQNPEPLELSELLAGERIYSSAEGDLDAYPVYSQAVRLTARFDETAGLYAVHIEVLAKDEKTESESYVYIGGAP